MSSFQLAHSIRLLLEYTDTSYEDKKYSMGDGDYTLFLRPLTPPVAQLSRAPRVGFRDCPF